MIETEIQKMIKEIFQAEERKRLGKVFELASKIGLKKTIELIICEEERRNDRMYKV